MNHFLVVFHQNLLLLKFENSGFYSFHCFQSFLVSLANRGMVQMFLLAFFINFIQLLALLLILHLQTFHIHHSCNQKNSLYCFILFFSWVNFLNHQCPPFQNLNIDYFPFFKLEILMFYANSYNHFETSAQSSYHLHISYFIYQINYFNDHHQYFLQTLYFE